MSTHNGSTTTSKAPVAKPVGLEDRGKKNPEIVAKIKPNPLAVARTVLTVVGTTPLLMNAWSSEAKEMMRCKQQQGTSTRKKELKDPIAHFNGSRYLNAAGEDCVPVASFAQAIVGGARWTELKMTELRGTFFIIAPDGLLKIHGSEPRMREDMVRVFGGVSDMRYRAEYEHWSVDLVFEYNERAITVQQLVDLVNLAGFSVGVGNWRPEKDGTFGRFAVDLSGTTAVMHAAKLLKS
jgi:hypothetical protein